MALDISGMLESYGKSVSGQTAAEALAYERQAQAQKIQQMQQAAQTYGSYRPQQQAARMNALSNISTAYQPANNALATLYGGGTGQVPFAARPQGYQPITRGGSAGQQSYRPVPTAAANPYPALQDARNPPGSTLPARPPTPSALTPPGALPGPGSAPAVRSALTDARTPPGTVESSARPTLSSSQLMRAAEVYGAPATKTLANTTAAPKTGSSILAGLRGGGGVLQAGAAAKGPSTVSSARPMLPGANPQSPVPALPGMGGAPSGSTQGVGGSGANLGLQPGPQLGATGMPPQSMVGAQGAAGVSFQPTQIFNNPFNLPPGYRPGTMPTMNWDVNTELPTTYLPPVGGNLPVATELPAIDPSAIAFHPNIPTSMQGVPPVQSALAAARAGSKTVRPLALTPAQRAAILAKGKAA